MKQKLEDGSEIIPPNSEYAFAIVGLGPCGLMAAIKLGQKLEQENPQQKIIAFEKRASPLRQQAVNLNSANHFIKELASSPEDAAFLKQISTQLAPSNLKDVETFLKTKLPKNVEVVYLDENEELDIQSKGEQPYIRVNNNKTGQEKNYPCRHILATDGANQYSLKCIEKNFKQPLINITEKQITYHASVQLKVDTTQEQQYVAPSPPAPKADLSAYLDGSTLVLNRSGAGSKNQQKYSVTLQITKELFDKSDDVRKNIILDIAKDQLISKHPHISKDTLIIHQSKNKAKKDKLQILPFTFQKRYCLNSVIQLHSESQDWGICLPLGNARKTPNYIKGEGISNALDDVNAAVQSFNFQTLSFDSEQYGLKLKELDQYYLDEHMRYNMSQFYVVKHAGTSPRAQLEYLIKNGAIKRENNKLTFSNNEEMQAIFNETHRVALSELIERENITQVCITSTHSKQHSFIAKIMDVVVQAKCTNTLYIDSGDVSPQEIDFIQKHGHHFKDIEIATHPYYVNDWKSLIKTISDKEESQLRSLIIRNHDGSNVKEFDLEIINLELMLLLKQISGSNNSVVPDSLINLYGITTHDGLLKRKEELLERARIDPLTFNTQLLQIQTSLPNNSPLLQHLLSITTLVKQKIDQIGNYLRKMPHAAMELIPSEKKLIVHLSEEFEAADELELLAMLLYAQKEGISTLVITMPSIRSLYIGYMKGVERIIKQLDTVYGGNISNLVIMPRASQQEKSMSSNSRLNSISL